MKAGWWCLFLPLACGGQTNVDDDAGDRGGFVPAEVEVLDEGFRFPRELHLMDGALYFGDFYHLTIHRLPVDGSGAKQLTSALNDLGGITVGEGRVYWKDAGNTRFEVYAVDAEGSEPELVVSDDEGGGRTPTFFEGEVYWLRISDAPYAVVRAAVPNGTPEVMVNHGDGIGVFTIANGCIYYTTGAMDLGRIPIEAPRALDDIPLGKAVEVLVADANHLYFASRRPDVVPLEFDLERVDLRSRVLETLSGPHDFIVDVELDGDHVYFASEQGIARIPKAGGDAQTVANTRSEFIDLVVDETHVYWIASDAGTISRVRKPESAR